MAHAPLSFVPVDPYVAFDTRINQGGTGPIVNGPNTFQIPNLPGNAKAVHLNLVAIAGGQSNDGDLKIAKKEKPRPEGSLVNFKGGQNNSNTVSIEVNSNDKIDVWVNPVGVTVDVRGVVFGYYVKA